MAEKKQFNRAAQATQWLIDNPVKGFLAAQEGEALYALAKQQSHLGAALEIGSYCGKSTVYLAAGLAQSQQVVFAVDHHQGSEEHQLGEAYHDPDLYDAQYKKMNSFSVFQHTIAAAGLSTAVIPVVTSSDQAAKHWATPLALVFIDGGHSPEMAMRDVCQWAKKIMPGGVMAIHDIYPTPNEGGQGPRLAMQALLDQGEFEKQDQILSMAILKRVR